MSGKRYKFRPHIASLRRVLERSGRHVCAMIDKFRSKIRGGDIRILLIHKLLKVVAHKIVHFALGSVRFFDLPPLCLLRSCLGSLFSKLVSKFFQEVIHFCWRTMDERFKRVVDSGCFAGRIVFL